MSANGIAAIASISTFVLAALSALFATRRSRRTRHLVWDEIIGHDASLGVPYKPSLSERITTLSDQTDARFDSVNGRLRGLETHATTAAQASAHAAIVAEEIKSAIAENGH